jgi:hypothetical protein
MANAPDLIMNVIVTPASFTGSSPANVNIKVRALEVNGIPSNGSTITARVKKDNLLVLNITPGTVISGWTYQGVTGVFHIFTSNVILNNSASEFTAPFTFLLPGGSGKLILSSALASGSGGELNAGNNSDQDVVTYNP